MHNAALTKRSKFYILITWFIIGVLLVCAAFFTYANGFSKVSFSRDNNDIYEVRNDMFQIGKFEDDHYKIVFPLELQHNNEHYVRITIKGVLHDDTRMTVKTGNLNENSDFVIDDYFEEYPLHDGIKDYKLSTSDFVYIVIDIYGEKSIVLQGLQFRESIEPISLKGAIPVLCATAGLYVLLTILFVAFIRHRKKLQLSREQSGYRNKHFALTTKKTDISVSISSDTSPALASFARTTLFFLMMAISILLEMEVHGFSYKKYFHQYLLLQMTLVVLVILFMPDRDHPMFKRKMDVPALVTCGCLALYTLISDILVDKWTRFGCVEIVLVLLVYGYVWYLCKRNETYLKDFERAVQWFLLFLLILSILFRNDATPERFSGPIDNPSIYALYLGTIWAVLLASLETHIDHRINKAHTVLIIVELLITAALLLLAQALTPMIAVFAVTFLWGFRFISKRKGTKTAIITSLVVILLIAICSWGLIWYIRRPEYMPESRLLLKLKSASLTVFLSGRDYYWKKYLMNMNLFGHGEKPFLWTRTIRPHNGLIGVAYMYGVPCVVPYIIMMIMAVEKAYRYANTGLKYSAIPLYSIVAFLVMSMADNVERPFIWLPWIACYLMMAPILVMPVEEMKKENDE